ncbi:MAG: pyridoxamine kinase [Eubacterium sp.]|nr:pyridoxamine kinase [Eubacterium sp.]
MKKIAVINDLSGFGKCSLTAALPVIAAHGLQACPLPTGVFSNQTGYDSFKSVDLTESMQGFIDEWKKLSVTFDGILTGFIPNSRQGAVLARFIQDFKTDQTVVAVDPIMGDDGAVYPCYDGDSIAAVKQLAAMADMITPNLTELALLCDQDPGKPYSPEEICAMSAALPAEIVITTGIPVSDQALANAVYDHGHFRLLTVKRLGQHFSGTGDIFSAFVLSEYLNGAGVFEAVERASAFIERAIAETLKHEPEQHYHPDGIAFETLLTMKD